MKPRLRDRRVYITGAGSGIGRALVREFLKEGSRVLAIDLNSKALEDLKAETALLGFGTDTLTADVGDRKGFLEALEAAAGRHGAPEIFVNNAGIAKVGSFLTMGLEAFEDVLRVNLDGVVSGTYFALSKMEPAGGGLIVNMASLAGHVPLAFMASYSASKFAVVGLTRALQAELDMAKSPVRMCLVSPGFIDTPIMDQEEARFPSYLRWMVGRPDAAAREIVQGIKSGRGDIYPDAGGRMMKRFSRLAPNWAVKSSRLLLAKSLSQLIGKDPIRPHR